MALHPTQFTHWWHCSGIITFNRHSLPCAPGAFMMALAPLLKQAFLIVALSEHMPVSYLIKRKPVRMIKECEVRKMKTESEQKMLQG